MTSLDRLQRWLERPSVVGVAAMLLAVVLTATAGLAYFDLYHRDVGWDLYVGEQILNGAILYTDVIDEHPPWLYWVRTVPVALSRVLGAEPHTVNNGLVFLLLAASVGFVYVLLLRGWPEVDSSLRSAIVMLVATSLVLLPGSEFGQREDILAATLMPYFFASASWLRGRPLGPWLAAAIGLFASIGLLFKPHFYLPCLFVEALLLLEGRGSWRRLEAWTIGCAAVAYTVSIPLLVPQYLDTIRLAVEAYDGYSQGWTLWVLVTPGVGWALVAVALCALFHPTSMNRELRRVLLAGIAGLTLAGFLQLKGWYYHYDAAKLTAAPLIGLVILSPLVGQGGIRQVLRASAALIPIIALALLFGFTSIFLGAAIKSQIEKDQTPRTVYEQLKRIVTEQAGTEPILVISTSIYPAFPLVNATGAAWASRYCCLWLLPGLYSPEEKMTTPFPYRTREEMGDHEREFLDNYVDDMLAARPTLLILDRTRAKQGFPGSSIDFLTYLLRDPRFAREFEHYNHVQDVRGYRVYKRVRPPGR